MEEEVLIIALVVRSSYLTVYLFYDIVDTILEICYDNVFCKMRLIQLELLTPTECSRINPGFMGALLPPNRGESLVPVSEG